MNVLYVLNKEEHIKKQMVGHKANIYVLLLEECKVKEYTGEEIITELSIEEDKELKLGSKFMTGYKGMLIFKALTQKFTIDKVEFNCNYVDAYFIMQYILYSGQISNSIEMIGDSCEFSTLEGNLYRFPNYWIKHIENECIRLLNTKKYKWESIDYPLLSIIIPYYNLGKYIKETLKSLKESTYPNYEIIVVNDGSNDIESLNVLNEIKNNINIRIITQENKGLSEARNEGVRVAKGKYITFLDADDMVDNSYYTRCINVLEEHKEIDIVYSWVQFVDAKQETWPTFNLSFPYLLLSNMSAAFYVIRKEKFIKYGLNKAYMRQGMEDYDSLINLYKNGCTGVAIPEKLVKYRYRLDSMSKSFNPSRVIDIYNQIVEEHKEIYKLYSVDLIKLINANGPGYLWNNPTLEHPTVVLNSNEDINDVKYILIRLLNTKLGKLIVKLLKIYKNKKGIR